MRVDGDEARVSATAVNRRALLREPALLALLARDVLSIAGSQMTWVALPWFVLTTTGSAQKMAFVVAAMTAGLGVVGFAAGNVVARLGPRRTMLVSDAARAPVTAAIPALHVAGALSFPLLLALVFAIGSLATPAFAARAALLPEIVGEDEGALGEANALLQGAMSLSVVLAPPIAGVLIGLVGVTAVLFVDALALATGFLLIVAFVRVGDAAAEAGESRGLAAGVRFLLADRLLRPWSVALVASDVARTAFFISLPFLVLSRFGDRPELLGWLMGGFGAGSVVGSAVVFRIVRDADRVLLASVAKLAGVAPLWCILADLPPAVLVAAMAATGLATGIANAPVWTILTLRTPPALRAKAWSAIYATSSLIQPVALLAAGPALTTLGLTPTLLALLIVHTGAALLFTSAGLRERTADGVTGPPATSLPNPSDDVVLGACTPLAEARDRERREVERSL